MDKISILNLRIPGRHGVYDFEKKKDGIFELDIEMFLDLFKSGQSDDLIYTIDYASVTEATIKTFKRKQYNLIESLAENICNDLFEQFPIKKIKIKIRKPHAPIKANFEAVEVQLIRERY